jgi:hypothetical protein
VVDGADRPLDTTRAGALWLAEPTALDQLAEAGGVALPRAARWLAAYVCLYDRSPFGVITHYLQGLSADPALLPEPSQIEVSLRLLDGVTRDQACRGRADPDRPGREQARPDQLGRDQAGRDKPGREQAGRGREGRGRVGRDRNGSPGPLGDGPDLARVARLVALPPTAGGRPWGAAVLIVIAGGSSGEALGYAVFLDDPDSWPMTRGEMAGQLADRLTARWYELAGRG